MFDVEEDVSGVMLGCQEGVENWFYIDKRIC